jgi:MoaA/NifB/PqqE/SkfB family radical SAM enzyme
MRLTYFDPKKDNWFLVAWTLSNKCNYRCSYCPSFLNDGSTGQPNWDTVEHFIKNFKVPNKEICFRLSGGEPTYWKYFLNLAKLVKEQGHYFSFLTNGSQTPSYYKEISKYSDGIMISFHEEYANVDHIIDVVNSIECAVVINLMMVQDKFDHILTIANKLYESCPKLAIWPKVVLDKTSAEYVTNKVSNYTEEQQLIIKKWPYFRAIDDSKIHRGNLLLDGVGVTGNDLILKELNQYKGWSCWAGIDMISVDMWGDVYRAECHQGGSIGTIKDFKLPDRPLICSKDVCNCLSDIYLKKENS